jgi:hypothetical protein
MTTVVKVDLGAGEILVVPGSETVEILPDGATDLVKIVVEGPQGPPGEGGSGGGSSQEQGRRFAVIAGAAGPSPGGLAIESTGGQNRVLRIARTDLDGVPLTLISMRSGDLVWLTDDPAAPPITAYARYITTADPVDDGAWWTVVCTRETGPVSPPADGTPVRFGFTANTGGGGGLDEAAGDLRYVNADGDTITIADPARMGLLIKGAASQTADLLRVTDSANTQLFRVSSNGTMVATGNYTMQKAGPVFTVDATSSTATMSFKATAGNARTIDGYTGSTKRWSLRLGDSGTESGSDAGATFKLIGYSDDGATSRVAVQGQRATGLLTVIGDPTAPLGIATKQYVDAAGGGGGGGDVWQSYTPSVSGAGITLGDGLMRGRWARSGSTVHFMASIGFGATTAVGSGPISIALPVAWFAGPTQPDLHARLWTGSGSDQWYSAGCVSTGSGGWATVYAIGPDGRFIPITASSPFAWSQGAQIVVGGTYETSPLLKDRLEERLG